MIAELWNKIKELEERLSLLEEHPFALDFDLGDEPMLVSFAELAQACRTAREQGRDVAEAVQELVEKRSENNGVW